MARIIAEISEGPRSPDRQKLLFDSGSSKTMHSKHLLQPDGHAHAFDVIAKGDLDRDGDVDAQDKSLTWDRKIYTTIAEDMKEAARIEGVVIRWGGDFKSFFDGVHFELA